MFSDVLVCDVSDWLIMKLDIMKNRFILVKLLGSYVVLVWNRMMVSIVNVCRLLMVVLWECLGGDMWVIGSE